MSWSGSVVNLLVVGLAVLTTAVLVTLGLSYVSRRRPARSPGSAGSAGQGQPNGELGGPPGDLEARANIFAGFDAGTAMLQAIVANNQAAIYVKDLHGRYLMANPVVEEILRRPAAEIVGLTDDAFDAELAPLYRANDLRAQRGTVMVEEFTDALADGRHYFQSVKFPLYDRSGALYATCGCSLDVTAERRASALLEQRRDVASSANATKSTFLATMSHEIRTPMNAVIGMTDLLLDTTLDEQQHEFVETVRASGDALLAVINDILDFSKIEAGEMRIECQPFDLREEVESCLDLVVVAASDKGLDLICHVEESCPAHVQGDAARLRQIIANLLSNAVKFTAAGEILITVSAAQDDSGGIPLTVTVTDTGIGISEDGVLQLFDSFSQIDASTTRDYGGTGLGLAISQRLAEAMGGEVSVTSALGVGSTFTLNVVVEPSVDDIPLADEESVAELAGLNVLVVDDNVTALRVLDLQLSALGMHCTSVATPQAAIELVRSGYSYDVALLDMRMPTMTGVEMAAALRDIPGRTNGPLVLVTGLGFRPTGAGEIFASLLAKPVKSANLRHALLNALQRGRPGQADGATGRVERDARPLRILLAEDNLVNQRVAQLMLGKLGHAVDTVDNGRAAVEHALDNSYDVILMDIQMPVLDGLEATRQIRSTVPFHRLPHIIAMTASVLVEDRQACARAGMESYLTKPVRALELESMLDRVTDLRATEPLPATALAALQRTAPAGSPQCLASEPVDEAVLSQLTAQIGDDDGELLGELVDSYLTESRGEIARLASAADAKDARTVLKVAHTLRSTSGLLGAAPLVALLRNAEAAAQERPAELPAAVALVQVEYVRVRQALARLARPEDREKSPQVA